MKGLLLMHRRFRAHGGETEDQFFLYLYVSLHVLLLNAPIQSALLDAMQRS